MIPRAKFLDPRPWVEAERRPIRDAVNIPLANLPMRLHELTPKPGEVFVAAETGLAEATIQLLRDRGRSGRAVEFAYGGEGGPARLWSPNPMLESFVERTPPGRAIDLGCGTGRDANYLASAGWQVLAIDRLPDALARGQVSAHALLPAQDRIEWRCADLEHHPDIEQDAFDLAILFLVRSPQAIPTAARALKIGGTLLFEGLSREHWRSRGKERSLTEPNPQDFDELSREQTAKTVRIIARRAGP